MVDTPIGSTLPDPRVGMQKVGPTFGWPSLEELAAIDEAFAKIGKLPEELAAIREALDQMERASALMDTLTDEDKLRWVLVFLETDLDHLSPEEQRDRSYELRALMPSRPIQPMAYMSMLQPLPLGHLKSLQAQIRQGLHALMLDPRPLEEIYADPFAGWTLPAVGTRLLRRSAIDDRDTVVLVWNYAPDEPTKIIHTVADLIRRTGQRLRVCRQCRRLFVGRKRQAYCQPACSQKIRDRRRHDRAQPDADGR